MDKVLNVGIIGAGWISRKHVNGYLQSGKANIIAIADVNEENAKELMNEFGLDCKYYKDYKELLADNEVDSVSICAPNKFHGELTVAAAKAGKHIMAEKPFVANVEEAINSLKAIKENGVKCVVGYHRRFNPLYKEMKRLKENGDLGKVFFAQSDYIHNCDDLPIMEWALKKEFNPSSFAAGAGHCIDTLLHIVDDEITEVSAFVDNTSCPQHGSEAAVLSIFRLKNGGMLKVTQIAPSVIAPFTFNVDVYGTKGTFLNNQLLLDTHPNFRHVKRSEAYTEYPDFIPDNTDGITEPWDVEIMEFVEWALGNKQQTELCSAEEAVKVAEACWAAVISNEEKRIVELPLIDYSKV